MELNTEITDSRRVRFFKDGARKRSHRVSRQIVGTALSLAVCMWSFIAWSLMSEYEMARATAQTQEHNLIVALAGEVTLTLDAADDRLRLVRNLIEAAPSSQPSTTLQAYLRQDAADRIHPAPVIRVAGVDGKLLFSSNEPDSGRTADLGPVDVSQLPHFISHRDNEADQLIVEPIGEGLARTLSLSRRLRTPDGQFGGEASVLLRPANLLDLHRELDLGRRGIVVIAAADGRVLAGFDRDHPEGSMGLGSVLHDTANLDDLQPAHSVVYTGVDQVARLETIHRLGRYGLDVLIGLDSDDVLRAARGQLWLICSVGFGTSLLIAALTRLLVREVWRRTRREIELAADRERLQLAQDQIAAERTRLAETSHELLSSKQRAEVANHTKSQFLAHMSHELRTPLHAIIGFSELIRDQAPTNPGAPPIAGYAADILTSGRHLLDLINTILDISKIESGTATLAETLFPAADLVRNAMLTIRSQAEARHITIDLRLPDTPIRLFADRTRLLQVLINLLSNAVKFTPDDGRIVVAVALNQAGEAILSVIDSGIGMTEEEMQVAFQPFGQVDNALSRSFEGTGLGLPLAGRLAELHGGRLELSSIKGRGTAARVTLPASRVGRRTGATA